MKRKSLIRIVSGIAPALLLVACAGSSTFTVADSNGDQKMSPQEFELYMLEAVFAEADADGNAKVTFEEWKAANPDADPDKFRTPDTNGDEMISPQEAKAHFAKQGTWNDLFAKMDTDNDGYISSAEAVAFRDKLAAESGTPVQKLNKASQ